MNNLLQVDTHFAFGENWKSFVKKVDEERILAAEAGLQRLLRREELTGKSFLDIGSGSGLSALAAARLGVDSITATDIDQNSVEATRTLLGANLEPSFPWKANVLSVFDLPDEQYDVVYSWGVLHHTGDMWRAIRTAAMRVKPSGLLALAIYAKTPLCGFWRIEKALYTRAPKIGQACTRAVFRTWSSIVTAAATRTNPFSRRETAGRGMDESHDVHDWLGGYPYKSASPEEMRSFVSSLGFVAVRENLVPGGRHGLLGSGCDEYLFRRA